jgi:hypothetical protein
MSRRFVCVCILALAGITVVPSTLHWSRDSRRTRSSAEFRKLGKIPEAQIADANGVLDRPKLTPPSTSTGRCLPRERRVSPLAIPMTFEPNIGQLGGELGGKFGGQINPGVEFIGRGEGMTLLLTRDGMDLDVADRSPSREHPRINAVRIRVGWSKEGRGSRSVARSHITRGGATGANAGFAWHGEGRLRTVSNYLIGRNPRAWRTNVPHFERAVATSDSAQHVGLVVYGSRDGAEYDLSLPARSDVSRLRLRFSGAKRVELSDGDVIFLQETASCAWRSPKFTMSFLAEFERPLAETT